MEEKQTGMDMNEERNAIFDERFESLREEQQRLIRFFFGLHPLSVAEAVIVWMESSDCSPKAREIILNYKEEYQKLMKELKD